MRLLSRAESFTSLSHPSPSSIMTLQSFHALQALDDVVSLLRSGAGIGGQSLGIRAERFMRACEWETPGKNTPCSEGETDSSFHVPVTESLRAVLSGGKHSGRDGGQRPHPDFVVEIHDLGEVRLVCEVDGTVIRLGQLDHRQRATLLSRLGDNMREEGLSEAARAELSGFRASGRFIHLPDRIEHDGSIRRALKQAGGRHVRHGEEEAFEFSGRLLGSRVIRALVSSGPGRSMPSDVMDALLGEILLDIDRADVLIYGGLDDRLAVAVSKLSPASLTIVEPDDQGADALIRKGFKPIELEIHRIDTRSLKRFDVILGVPPFGKTRDIEAVTSLMRFLKPGGVLCAITTAGWQYGADPVRMRFREQFAALGMQAFDRYPAEAFRGLGVMVPTMMIRHDAPACKPSSRMKIV